MCNISSFAQIRSVLAQRSTAHTRLVAVSSHPGKGPIVWYLRKMPSSQMDTSAVQRASTHDSIQLTIWKKENGDFMKLDIWPPNSPDLNPGALCGAFSNESITDENLTRWKNWRQR